MRHSAITVSVSALGLALAVSLGVSLVQAQNSNTNGNTNSTSTTNRKFIRGDANDNGKVDLDDLKVYNNLQQFRPVARPENMAAFVCKDAADVNDDGKISVDDAAKLIDHLFGSKSALKAPFPAAGADPTADNLGC